MTIVATAYRDIFVLYFFQAIIHIEKYFNQIKKNTLSNITDEFIRIQFWIQMGCMGEVQFLTLYNFSMIP